MPPHHRITVSPNQSVICLAPCHQTSQSFALPPATKAVSHLTCPLPPHHHVTVSPCHRVTMSPCWSVICLAPCHQTSQSFALPPATKPVSHLTCPLPPHHCITMLPCHRVTTSRVTMLVSHLPCPLPPNQSVICLAPCHQTSQSFDLPSTTALPHHHITTSPCHHVTVPPCHCVTASPCHRITASPRHCLRFSPPHGYESDWLMLTSTVLIG